MFTLSKLPTMKTTLPITILALLLFPVMPASAQNMNRQKTELLRADVRKNILLPRLDDFLILKGDFHMHTIFSDGAVWPVLRVEEAWADGLDAIAITDHAEYRPHEKYLQADLNTSFQIAAAEAKRYGITLLPAIEITKWKMPPGHMNALFITDGNIPELNDTTPAALLTALDKLKKQGAFFIWNHPGWDAQQKDTVRWFPLHDELWSKGFINGIEIFNFEEWYPVALKWAMEKNLAPFANTDTHDPVSMTYRISPGFIRPMTLILCRENTPESIREAMFDRRTVAWFDGHLAGRSDLLEKLFDKSLNFRMVDRGNDKKYYEAVNPTDFDFHLKFFAGEKQREMKIPKQSAVRFSLPENQSTLRVEVMNWHTGMQQNLIREIQL